MVVFGEIMVGEFDKVCFFLVYIRVGKIDVNRVSRYIDKGFRWLKGWKRE